jgi:hypothetical protein
MNSNKSKKNHMHEIAVPIGLYIAKQSVKTVKDKKDNKEKKTKKNKKSNKKKVVTRVRKVAVGGVAPTSDLSDSIHLKNALSNSFSASEYTGLEGGVWPFSSKKKTSVVTPMPKPQNNSNNSNNNTKSINSKNIPNMFPQKKNNSNANSMKSNNSNNIPNMYPQKKNNSNNSNNIPNNIPSNNVKGGNAIITYYKYWVNKELKSLSASQSNMPKNERLLTVRKLWNEYKNMPQFERNKNNYNRRHGLTTSKSKNNKVKIQNAGTSEKRKSNLNSYSGLNTNKLNKESNELRNQKDDNNIEIKKLEKKLIKTKQEYDNKMNRKGKLYHSMIDNSRFNRNTSQEEKKRKAIEYKKLEGDIFEIGNEKFTLERKINELKKKNKIIDDNLEKISVRLVVRDGTKGQAQNNIVQTVSKHL